ncbi:hypothetical protein D5085_06700 [Ectothiorhodospiraceae bacterium BW-2]|nr:hypothetical protein D5085_06700 [Ectothiorhodospiraceae bacterium BW-2]
MLKPLTLALAATLFTTSSAFACPGKGGMDGPSGMSAPGGDFMARAYHYLQISDEQQAAWESFATALQQEQMAHRSHRSHRHMKRANSDNDNPFAARVAMMQSHLEQVQAVATAYDELVATLSEEQKGRLAVINGKRPPMPMHHQGGMTPPAKTLTGSE